MIAGLRGLSEDGSRTVANMCKRLWICTGVLLGPEVKLLSISVKAFNPSVTAWSGKFRSLRSTMPPWRMGFRRPRSQKGNPCPSRASMSASWASCRSQVNYLFFGRKLVMEQPGRLVDWREVVCPGHFGRRRVGVCGGSGVFVMKLMRN